MSEVLVGWMPVGRDSVDDFWYSYQAGKQHRPVLLDRHDYPWLETPGVWLYGVSDEYRARELDVDRRIMSSSKWGQVEGPLNKPAIERAMQLGRKRC